MKTLRYNAPAHHSLTIPLPDGKKIAVEGGGTFRVPDGVAEELLTAPYADVLEAEEENLAAKSRDELNAIAAASGIEAPDKLPNKEAVIAAIENPPTVEADEGSSDAAESGG